MRYSWLLFVQLMKIENNPFFFINEWDDLQKSNLIKKFQSELIEALLEPSKNQMEANFV